MYGISHLFFGASWLKSKSFAMIMSRRTTKCRLWFSDKETGLDYDSDKKTLIFKKCRYKSKPKYIHPAEFCLI